MKTYEEMAKYVLEVRDEHDKKKKHRIAAAKRVIPAAAGAFCTFIIVFGIFKGYNRPDTFPVNDNIIESETTSAQVTTLTQTTNKSGTALTTAATSAEKSTSKTAVSETKATTVKTEVTSVTSSDLTSAVTSSAAEHTTAAASSTASVTAAITSSTVLTTQEVITTSADGGEGDQMTGGGGMTEGGGGCSGDMPGGGAGGDGNGGYAGGGYAGGGTGGSGGTEEERWSQLTINHRYYYAFIDGYEDVYVNGYMIPSDIVGSWIGEAEMESQTFIDGYIKKCSADVYFINGYSDDEVVAIKFKSHDEYYLYCKINTDIYDIMKKIPPHQ